MEVLFKRTLAILKERKKIKFNLGMNVSCLHCHKTITALSSKLNSLPTPTALYTRIIRIQPRNFSSFFHHGDAPSKSSARDPTPPSPPKNRTTATISPRHRDPLNYLRGRSRCKKAPRPSLRTR